MTRGRFLFSDLRRVAIRATAALLSLLKLFFYRRDPGIGRLFVVLVTSCADRNWNIGSETAQRACPGDIDVTGRALHYMLALAALVTELD